MSHGGVDCFFEFFKMSFAFEFMPKTFAASSKMCFVFGVVPLAFVLAQCHQSLQFGRSSFALLAKLRYQPPPGCASPTWLCLQEMLGLLCHQPSRRLSKCALPWICHQPSPLGRSGCASTSSFSLLSSWGTRLCHPPSQVGRSRCALPSRWCYPPSGRPRCVSPSRLCHPPSLGLPSC